MEIRLGGAGSCEKPSSYLTIEHCYCIFKTCGIILEYSEKTFLYFIKWRKKKIIDNPPNKNSSKIPQTSGSHHGQFRFSSLFSMLLCCSVLGRSVVCNSLQPCGL